MGTTDPISALLVEDEERLARLTADYLRRHGVTVTVVSDGVSAFEEAVSGKHDVVLLDVMLPEMSGIEVCRALRRHSAVPVILITARGGEADRVLGLDTGADDYLVKPFSARELVARIEAVVRRARGKVGPSALAIRVGGLSIDAGAQRATLDGRELSLTGYEFALLKVLAERAGRVLSREQLMALVTGNSEEAFDRSVDVHICHLRLKLGDNSREQRMLKTIRGAGYVLQPPFAG